VHAVEEAALSLKSWRKLLSGVLLDHYGVQLTRIVLVVLHWRNHFGLCLILGAARATAKACKAAENGLIVLIDRT